MLGIHLVGCLSLVSTRAETDQTQAVIETMPTAAMAVFDAQFFGLDHQPPAGDQMCFGSRSGQKIVRLYLTAVSLTCITTASAHLYGAQRVLPSENPLDACS